MAPVETQEQFVRWLENQTKDMSVAVDVRNALRVFPIVTHSVSHDTARKILACLTNRRILTSGLSPKMPSPE